MEKLYKRIFISLLTTILYTNINAQVYGPELIPQGNFGTIISNGKNGDNNSGQNIYPDVNGIGSTIPFYYQPPQRVFHNGNLVYINVNPGVTIGKPIPGKTSYVWGFTEPWITDTYDFPTVNNTNSYIPIPHAPNNGNYLIVTSTKGMYNLPSLSIKSWYEIVDKYEVNPDNPQNYFLVVNADQNANKIFYKEQVGVIPGQAYRMSVDLAKLNLSGVNPNVSFIINTNESQLTTATPTFETGSLNANNGEWVNYYFDYIAPCNVGNSTFIAFRNNVAGGNGNDLALDNLSMKAIIPLISAEINSCDQASFIMLDGGVLNAFPTSKYKFQWQIKNNDVFNDISGATSTSQTISETGIYRLAIYTDATIGCPMYSNEIEIGSDDNSCLIIPNPDAMDDQYTVVFSGRENGYVLDNDTTSNTQTVPHSALSVSSFEVNNITYPSGSTAIVRNSNGDQIGVITLNSDGSFTYDPVPGFIGSVPPINILFWNKTEDRTAQIYT